MADGSTKVLYANFAGNVLVAVSKFVAAALSGSSAMLTEAIHSSADCINQVLLLIGNRRSLNPADKGHPFGYGAEIYFWTSMVAVMVLIGGGALSIYQGVLQLKQPEPVHSAALSLIVLAISALFEGATMVYSLREVRSIVAMHPWPDGRSVGLWKFIQVSKDPNMYENILENWASLAGLGIAALGVLGSAWLHWLWADGAASILIGVLLAAVSWVIMGATRRLVAGEPVAFPLQVELERALSASSALPHGYGDLRTLHLGPRTILLALTVRSVASQSVEELRRNLDQLKAEVRAVDPRFEYIFFGVD